MNTFKYEQAKVLLDKYTIIEASRTREVYNWLQCYSEKTLSNEFETNGFEVENVYSDVTGSTFRSDAAEIAIVARKP